MNTPDVSIVAPLKMMSPLMIPGIRFLHWGIRQLPHHLVSFERHFLQPSRWVQVVEEDGGGLGAAGLPPDAAPPVVAVLLLDRHGKAVLGHHV